MIRPFSFYRLFQLTRRKHLKFISNGNRKSDLLSSPLTIQIQSMLDQYTALSMSDRILFMKEFQQLPSSPNTARINSDITTFLYTITLCPEGLKFILLMRTDLNKINSSNTGVEYLTELTNSIQQLTALWSRNSFLTFKLVSPDSSNELLDNLIRSEAVHSLSGREELHSRITNGSCYVVTHDQLSPNLPISMVYYGLINYFPTHIKPVLNAVGFKTIRPQNPTTACFYTISNAHTGFSGTEVSHQLIKHAVASIRSRYPSIHTFVTLSPIPNFRTWLANNNKSFSNDLSRFSMNERRELMSECARYLVEEKNGKRALDPVANFHIKNGATLRRINWLANPSEKAMLQSFGMMANYLYDLDNLDNNRSRYLEDGIVSISEDVDLLLHQ